VGRVIEIGHRPADRLTLPNDTREGERREAGPAIGNMAVLVSHVPIPRPKYRVFIPPAPEFLRPYSFFHPQHLQM